MKEKEILNQRKKLARIDTRVIKEFGEMIKPKEAKILMRHKLRKVQKKLRELDEGNFEKTHKILDKLTYKLEDYIDKSVGLDNMIIIGRIHIVGIELINTIETTRTFEICKDNKELADVVVMYSFEDGWGFDTRDFIKDDKNKSGVYQ